MSPGWTQMRCAAGCGSWPQPGCSPTAREAGSTGRGMRCCPRRWPLTCCPVSGRCCTSGQPWRSKAAGDETLAAEVAGHWAAAGRPAEELPARVAAAAAAERVFGYAEAAAHWQRAIELCQAVPAPHARPASTCRGCTCGPSRRWKRPATAERAGELAEEAYRPVRRSPRPRDRRGHPPAGRVLPGHAHARCRAAADQGGAAAVRAGSAVGRPGRGLALLRHDLLVRGRGAAGGQPHRPESRAGDRRVRWRRCGHLPHPARSWQSIPSFAGRSRKGSPCFAGGRPWPRHPGIAKPPCGWPVTKATPCSNWESSKRRATSR